MAELVRAQEAALIAARVAAAAPKAAALPSHARARVLEAVAAALEREKEAFAALICREVAKPIKEARREVARAVFTFRWAAGEALRSGGPWMPLDLEPNSEGRLALVRRFPKGPCLFITPFNFPLNLVAHKVAPAVAVGAPFLLKPAPQAPRTALELARLLKEAGWPEEAMAVVCCDNETAQALVEDERFAVLSFTGSAGVGWRLKALCGRKHAVLELGGNAGVVVAADADLALAAARSAWGGFYYSGQTCISVQSAFVEAPVYAEFKRLLLENVAELKTGDPADEATDVGPLIDEKAAERVEAWIEEALKGGGKLLAGGKRRGRIVEPTVIEEPPASCRVSCEEVFGPVVTLHKVASAEAALERIARGSYALQAGLFTKDLGSVLSAWERVPVGGLIVNDIPSYRSDAMPYGGNKLSGIGREGVRWAMEEYTEPRTLVLKA